MQTLRTTLTNARKLEAFAEAQALISKLPRETVLDTMSHEDMETQFERRSV